MLSLPIAIEAGKSLVLEGIFSFFIVPEAYSILKSQQKPMTLSDAETLLSQESVKAGNSAREIEIQGLFGKFKAKKSENYELSDDVLMNKSPNLFIIFHSIRGKFYTFPMSFYGRDINASYSIKG